MAAGKYQLEPLVRKRQVIHLFCSSLSFPLKQVLKNHLFTGKCTIATQAVNSLAPRSSGHPGTRIVGYALDRPAFKRNEQRVLEGILSELEIPHKTNQAGEDAIGLLAKGLCHNPVCRVHYPLGSIN